VTTGDLHILRSSRGSTVFERKGIVLLFCRRLQCARCRLGHPGGHYRVRIYGQWLVVPDDAVVTEPNRFGPAVVWPYNDRYDNTQIRCFMPGAGT
jgi:hypothetical protein